MTPAELNEFTTAVADAVASRLASRPRLTDRHDTATALGVSLPTLDRLRAAGRITPIMVGARVMFELEAVIAELRGDAHE